MADKTTTTTETTTSTSKDKSSDKSTSKPGNSPTRANKPDRSSWSTPDAPAFMEMKDNAVHITGRMADLRAMMNTAMQHFTLKVDNDPGIYTLKLHQDPLDATLDRAEGDVEVKEDKGFTAEGPVEDTEDKPDGKS